MAVRVGAEVGAPAELLGSFLVDLAAAAGGAALAAPQFATYRALGRQGAETGVALRVLVDLYLTAARRGWSLLPAVANASDMAELSAMTGAVLIAIDDAVATVCEGYQDARRSLAQAEEALRREFVDDLLLGTSDLAQLVDRAPSFGLRLESSHRVLVAAGNRPFLDRRVMVRDVESALLAGAPDRRGEPNLLVATKQGLLVCLVPAGYDSAPALIAARLGRESSLAWRLGASRPRSGAGGIRAGFEEARGAVELAERLGLEVRTVSAADLLVYQVLARDREPMLELVETVLLPLQAARGGAEPLLATLRAYFATGGVAVATAKLLHLSVRAVTYRLDRVTALTGRDPGDPEDGFILDAALRGARVLGWPNAPLTSWRPLAN